MTKLSGGTFAGFDLGLVIVSTIFPSSKHDGMWCRQASIQARCQDRLGLERGSDGWPQVSHTRFHGFWAFKIHETLEEKRWWCVVRVVVCCRYKTNQRPMYVFNRDVSTYCSDYIYIYMHIQYIYIYQNVYISVYKHVICTAMIHMTGLE